MITGDNSWVILLAEDDEDDYLITKRAFQKSHISNPLHHVKNGEELMDYLRRNGQYANENPPSPVLILLDLNMPKMDGREALKAIKSDPRLKKIPVVILTTSKSEEDILLTYELGANSFIKKPSNFDDFIKTLGSLAEYWLRVVKLPHEP